VHLCRSSIIFSVVAEFNDQSAAIKSILFKSDTMQLCSCSKDGSLFVWDIRQSGVTLQKKVGGIEKTFYQSVDFHLKTELFAS
jgi:WD40 repeat protein